MNSTKQAMSSVSQILTWIKNDLRLAADVEFSDTCREAAQIRVEKNEAYLQHLARKGNAEAIAYFKQYVDTPNS